MPAPRIRPQTLEIQNTRLQERLKNKQVFIQQVKHFQEELTLAYEQCKNELLLAQEKMGYLQNVQHREYTQQIADLKHMLLLAQQDAKRRPLARLQRVPLASAETKAIYESSTKLLKEEIQSFIDNSQPKENDHQKIRSFKKGTNSLPNQPASFRTFCTWLNATWRAQIREQAGTQIEAIKDVVKEWDDFLQQGKKLSHFVQELTRLYGVDKDVQLTILLELIRAKRLAAK